MKIFIVIDETSFFHPDFLNDLIENINHEVVGAGLVTNIPRKSNLTKYLIRRFYFLKFFEILKLALFYLKNKRNKFSSVEFVLKYHKIPYIKIKNNINNVKYVDFINNYSPDIIISSNSLIFKEEILSIPKVCCINRHSSLLPSYAGLWPIFHAYINDEKFVGVSVHKMNDKIDSGDILHQEKIPIKKNDTIFSLYMKSFKISSRAIILSIEHLDKSISPQNSNDSYFSFPTKADWKLFREKGGKFI